MSRRSTPQARIDERAFPVVLRVLIPERGLGSLGPENNLWAWLNDAVGPGNYAKTPHAALLVNATAFHFRAIEDALAFAPVSHAGTG